MAETMSSISSFVMIPSPFMSYRLKAHISFSCRVPRDSTDSPVTNSCPAQINQPHDQSIDQSVRKLVNQSVKQSVCQSISLPNNKINYMYRAVIGHSFIYMYSCIFFIKCVRLKLWVDLAVQILSMDKTPTVIIA